VVFNLWDQKSKVSDVEDTARAALFETGEGKIRDLPYDRPRRFWRAYSGEANPLSLVSRQLGNQKHQILEISSDR
jgi:hypothetical protein